MILVYRCRVKSLNGLLNQQSRAVNDVWNFCNDTQQHALKWNNMRTCIAGCGNCSASGKQGRQRIRILFSTSRSVNVMAPVSNR
ncbi:transposase [Burkholderia arboris]|uniref:Transposase n=1 Tax=Burkholderia arboris TaxID=488730 RepID=A0A9Q9SF62_9BURK|nr:transposase [Burkholderia arboris]